MMVDVDLEADRLRVAFTPAEALLGLVHDLDEPLSEVDSVTRLRLAAAVHADGSRLGGQPSAGWSAVGWAASRRLGLSAVGMGCRPLARPKPGAVAGHRVR